MISIDSFSKYFDDHYYYEFPNLPIWALNKKTNETDKLEIQNLSRGLMVVRQKNQDHFDIKSNSDIFIDESTMIMLVFEAKKVEYK